MKNSLFVLIISMLPVVTMAQDESKPTQLGFTLSPNLGWVSASDNSENVSRSPRLGFSYGILADLGFTDNYFFSTGFTLTSINSKEETEGQSQIIAVRKLQYIEIPVTLKLKSNPSSTGRFYGQFGLGTGINVKARQDVTTDDNASSADNVNISDSVRPFRLSLIAGAGAEWNVGRNLNILTGVTFNNGFSNVIKGTEGKNSYLALSLGVFF